MIQLNNVCKHYGNVRAVDGISFEVKDGETLVLLGTSGCGKTTTLRMINRLAEPTSGTIIVNNRNVQEQPPEKMRRGIGYVLQHHGLFPHYTVAENIAIVPDLLKWDKNKTQNRIAELLEKIRLPADMAGMYPAQLSGGQQQRVGLARALAAYQPVLLMDEPLGALDPVTRADIRKEFRELDELKRKTIVMVTHDVQEAFSLGDRICLMDKGKIVQIGTPAELLFHPSADFVTAFLKEQRFQLELETLTLKDIASLLPKAIDKVEEKQLIPEDSLWQILQSISATDDNSSYTSVFTIDSIKRQVNSATVMTAYLQYKNSLIHE